ncbi:hypothetical protein COF68_05970 [Bacillus toyonensis]|uniref:competence protein CoiA family protein n=1 Tax=Bacillus toyonensis TaxID=155322 RepID=UPI000BFD82D3|nr:competence protein CoiA family protein [Bacillus toyonensis]PHE64382.1 hypothetical protein COF68_05970 [Bacillus toyonensis]
MIVQLNFALDSKNSRVYHIEERLPSNVKYVCPYCKEEVHARKGSKRQHHFAHTKGSSCSVSRETLLHFESKNFLANRINKLNERHVTEERKQELDVEITSDISIFNEKYQSIFNAMGVKSYRFSLLELIGLYEVTYAETEKGMGNYIVDVLGDSKEFRGSPLVFEVFVTHKNEEGKTDYFNNFRVPYLELKPIEKGTGFEFELVNCRIHKFIEEKCKVINESLTEVVYENFKEDLEQKALSNVTESYKDIARKEITSQVRKQLEMAVSSINFREYIDGTLYKDMNSVVCLNSPKLETRREQLFNIDLKFHPHDKNKLVLLFNNSHILIEPTHLLLCVLDEIKEFYGVEIILANNSDRNFPSIESKVIGFNFLLPNKLSTGEQLKTILKKSVIELKDNPQKEVTLLIWGKNESGSWDKQVKVNWDSVQTVLNAIKKSLKGYRGHKII